LICGFVDVLLQMNKFSSLGCLYLYSYLAYIFLLLIA